MDCNKEEANRAKDLAEKKMQTSDFIGARKIALKAQQLYPELENISQLLTVCEIHCSSQVKILGSEMDWYGILQVSRGSDDVTIKKQYRKLALLLHPDKNKFAGAEAAFKLVGEANRVLSDQGKRSVYDIKCRVSVNNAAPKAPPHQANRNNYMRKPYVVPKPQFSGLNPNQAQPGVSNGGTTFWTACPFCNVRYQYYKDIMNRALRCQSCEKPFIAYDLGAQGPPAPNWSHSSSFTNQKEALKPSSGGHFPFSTGFKAPPSTAATGSEPFSKAEGKAKVREDVYVGVSFEGRKGKKASTSRNTMSRKRSRKSAAESSESCGTASSDETDEDVAAPERGGASGPADNDHVRRSSRQKQHVSYKESRSDDDDDFVSPPKKSKKSGSSGAAMDEDVDNSKPKEANETVEEPMMNGKGAATTDHSDVKSEMSVDSESNANPTSVPEPEIYEYPDPEFSDFEKDKSEESFRVDQLWAIYDQVDGMPRFYARINKVFSPGFKLRIMWLEPDPDDIGDSGWFEKGLPVACGKFKHGAFEYTTDRPMFSHQILPSKKVGKSSYVIYPRQGETWALFKDWDLKWTHDPENPKTFKFEFVEILKDFVEGVGIWVTYLDKLKDFVSLFNKTKQSPFLIPPSDLFRFSHRIPSNRMNGDEREGVPRGSFELDPASLPLNLEDHDHPGNLKAEKEKVNVGENGSRLKPTVGSEGTNTPKKTIDVPEKNGLETPTSNIRKSPMESNPAHKKPRNQEESDEPKSKAEPGSGPTSQVDGETNSHVKGNSSINSPKNKGRKLPEAGFHNFSAGKSEEKFMIGQVWALYSEDGLPKIYGVIKKIDEIPSFRLHVVVLEACLRTKDIGSPLCCGIFKLKTTKLKPFTPTAFSHQLKAKATGKGLYEVFPQKGQVWALYRNWNEELNCLENRECDVVEILESVSENEETITKVVILAPVDGLKSVYRGPRKRKTDAGILEIPRIELHRFSHQIPCFQLKEENNGSLRGCYELDPASLSGI